MGRHDTLTKQAWPGWYTDSQLAAEYAQQLSRQLAASVNAGRLAAAWLALHGTDVTVPASAPGEVAKARRRKRRKRRRRGGGGGGGQQQQPPVRQQTAARQFLAAQGVTAAIAAILLGLLTALWGAAWGLGWASAIAVLGVGEIKGAEQGLADLLREARGRIDGILQTRLSRLERVLDAALRDGISADELARQISAILGSLTSALLVTQSETTWASGRAAYWVYKLLRVKWVRWQTRNDGLVCPRCMANQKASPIKLGQRFPSGDKSPLAHPRCFPAGVMVTGPSTVAATSRWYEGDLVTVVFIDGQEVPVTPNHPVLTPDGWVAAGDLRKGSEVLRALDADRIAALIYPDDRQAVARIENVAGALVEAGPVSSGLMPLAPEDFHGDGAGDDYVKVVGAARHAVGDVMAEIGQQCPECGLMGTLGLPAFGDGDSAALLLGDLSPTAGGMGGFQHHSAVSGRGALPSELHGLGAAAAVDPSLVEHAVNGTAIPPVFGGSGLDRHAAQEVLDEPGRGRPATAVLEQSPFAQFPPEGAGPDATNGRALLDLLAGQVGLDRVAELRRVSWSGHVYNLETVSGWYFANGIIAHNCRCSLLPAAAPPRHAA